MIKLKLNLSKKLVLYPKSYIFKLTPKDKKEFSDNLKVGNEGLMDNQIKKEQKMEFTESKFKIIAIGHFDDQLHKPLKITKMFDNK